VEDVVAGSDGDAAVVVRDLDEFLMVHLSARSSKRCDGERGEHDAAVGFD
jgi:hypothetical protein